MSNQPDIVTAFCACCKATTVVNRKTAREWPLCCGQPMEQVHAAAVCKPPSDLTVDAASVDGNGWAADFLLWWDRFEEAVTADARERLARELLYHLKCFEVPPNWVRRFTNLIRLHYGLETHAEVEHRILYGDPNASWPSVIDREGKAGGSIG